MSHGAIPKTGEVIFEAGLSDDEVTARLDPGLGTGFQAILDEHEIAHGAIFEFSVVDDIPLILGLTVGPGSALWALRPVLVAWVEKNKGKSFRLKHDDLELNIDNCSLRDIDRFLEKLAADRQHRAEQWARLNRGNSGEQGE